MEELRPRRFPAEPLLQLQHHKPLFLQRCFQGLTTKGFCTKGPRAPLSVSLKSLTFLAKKGNDPAAWSTGTSGFYPCHEWVMAVHGPAPDLQEGEGDVMHKHPPRLPECGSETLMKILLSAGEECRGRAGAAARGEVGAGKRAGSPGRHWGCRKSPRHQPNTPELRFPALPAGASARRGVRDGTAAPTGRAMSEPLPAPAPVRCPKGAACSGPGHVPE